MWFVEDVKKLKEALRYRQHRERVFYPHLAKWVKETRKTSTIYVDPSEIGIDVIEVAKDDSFTGYEVKVPRIKKGYLDLTPINDGIGQALNYFLRGMDRAYLVTLQIEGLERLRSLLEMEAPLGLILITKDWEKPSFNEVLSAREPKAKHYERREVTKEILSWHRAFSPDTSIIYPII